MALHHTCGRCTRHPCEYNACKELLQHHSLPIVQNVWQDHFISLQICFVSSVWRFRRKLVFIATWEDLRVAPGGTVHAKGDYNTIDCKLSQKYARMTSFQYSDHSLPPYVVKRLNRSETPMGRMDVQLVPVGTIHSKPYYNTIDSKLSNKYGWHTWFHCRETSFGPCVVKRSKASEPLMGSIYRAFIWLQEMQGDTKTPLPPRYPKRLTGIAQSTAKVSHLHCVSLNVATEVKHPWEGCTDCLYGYKAYNALLEYSWLQIIQKVWQKHLNPWTITSVSLLRRLRRKRK